MGCSVSKLYIFPILVALGFILTGCKSSTPQFGIPEEKTGFFSRDRVEERSKKWGQKRLEWQRHESEKAKLMFDRAKGKP
jgi:hypothetical protein